MQKPNAGKYIVSIDGAEQFQVVNKFRMMVNMFQVGNMFQVVNVFFFRNIADLSHGCLEIEWTEFIVRGNI